VCQRFEYLSLTIIHSNWRAERTVAQYNHQYFEGAFIDPLGIVPTLANFIDMADRSMVTLFQSSGYGKVRARDVRDVRD